MRVNDENQAQASINHLMMYFGDVDGKAQLCSHELMEELEIGLKELKILIDEYDDRPYL